MRIECFVQIELARFCDQQQTVQLTAHDIIIGTTVGVFLASQGLGDVLNVGVFGKKVAMDFVLTPGDRVEVYEPLRIDPKQSRLKKLGKKYV